MTEPATCRICRDPNLPVSEYGHDWDGGRAHGACIVMLPREAVSPDATDLTGMVWSSCEPTGPQDSERCKAQTGAMRKCA